MERELDAQPTIYHDPQKWYVRSFFDTTSHLPEKILNSLSIFISSDERSLSSDFDLNSWIERYKGEHERFLPFQNAFRSNNGRKGFSKRMKTEGGQTKTFPDSKQSLALSVSSQLSVDIYFFSLPNVDFVYHFLVYHYDYIIKTIEIKKSSDGLLSKQYCFRLESDQRTTSDESASSIGSYLITPRSRLNRLWRYS